MLDDRDGNDFCIDKRQTATATATKWRYNRINSRNNNSNIIDKRWRKGKHPNKSNGREKKPIRFCFHYISLLTCKQIHVHIFHSQYRLVWGFSCGKFKSNKIFLLLFIASVFFGMNFRNFIPSFRDVCAFTRCFCFNYNFLYFHIDGQK